MSAPQSPRRNKKSPMFEVREGPLPSPPRPLHNTSDPFEDLPEIRPRTARRPVVATPARPPLPKLVVGEEEASGLPLPQSPLAKSIADLHRVQLLSGAPHLPRPALSIPAPRRTIPELFQDHPWLLAIACLLCIGFIMLASTPQRTIISRFGGRVNEVVKAVASAPVAPSLVAPPGEHSVLLNGTPMISAAVIDSVLAQYGSPAAGTGQVWVEMGQRYGIDPAYALAFFIHESSAGTNPGWAGIKPDGSTTHNVGNIICAGYPTCFGRFRDYGSWAEGIEDWYQLIHEEYVQGRGVFTVEQIIPIYAPSFENDVDGYVNVVVNLVNSWRQQGEGVAQ